MKCTFDEDLWNKIWTEIKNFLDRRKLTGSHQPKHIVSELHNELDTYIENYTKLVGEVPIVTTDVNEAEFRCSFRFSPNHRSVVNKYRCGPSLVDVTDMIHIVYVNTKKLLKEAYQRKKRSFCLCRYYKGTTAWTSLPHSHCIWLKRLFITYDNYAPSD